MSAPLADFAGPVGPGFTRPKHKRTFTGFSPKEIKAVESAIPEGQREAWKKHMMHSFDNKDDFERETVRHIETTLARSLFNCDEDAAYGGTALAFRDRLIVEWNKTQQRQTFADQKRLYCMFGNTGIHDITNVYSRSVPRIPHGPCPRQCHA